MPRVLIVDDEEIICRLLARTLTANGYDCTTATSARGGRAALKKQTYEVVLSDIRMPGESGLDFIEFVLSEYPETAAIMVSVMGDQEITDRAVEMGVYGYIVKPFNSDQVLISVASALHRRRLFMENRAYREKLENLVLERTSALEAAVKRLELIEDELRQSEEKYRKLVDNLPAVVYTSHADGTIDLVDKRIEVLTGYDPGLFLSHRRAWSKIVHPDDIAALRNAFHNAVSSSKNFVLEYRIKRQDGTILWIQDRGSIVCRPDGGIDYVSGVLFDITDAKTAKEALEKEKEKFQSLVENFPVGVSLVGSEGWFQYANPKFHALFGYGAEETANEQAWFENAFPDSKCREAALKAWNDRPEGTGTECPILNTLLVTSADGTEKEIQFNRVPLDDGSRIVIYTDVTEQKRAENELREAHRDVEQLLSAFSSVLIGIDGEQRVTRWNRIAEEVLGVPAAEVLGIPLRDCPVNWPGETIMDAVSKCRDRGILITLDEVRFTTSRDEERFLNVSIDPIMGGGRAPMGVLIVASDITEKKVLQAQLGQAQKLESIGLLAAGIAHEINTPTQYVGDNTRFLQDAFDDLIKILESYRDYIAAVKAGGSEEISLTEIEDLVKELDLEYLMEEVPKSIEESLQGLSRVAKIVLAMKEFSHPGTKEKSLVDINRAIESTITVARNEWKYVADMVTDFDTSLPQVLCHPGDVNQVILNIIINAAHAIKEILGEQPETKGTITVRTRKDSNRCEIRISDTGPGIPESIRSKVFDPFFTTKDVGKGTGQGLALSHDVIVEKHGGSISFDTSEKGTTFIIRLPIEDEAR